MNSPPAGGLPTHLFRRRVRPRRRVGSDRLEPRGRRAHSSIDHVRATSMKRVASAVSEGSPAVQFVHAVLRGD